MYGRGREITTQFGGTQGQNFTYLDLQERLHHKDFFAQVFYDQASSGNSGPTDPNGTYFVRTGIPIVDQSNMLGVQAQQGLRYGRTRMVIGGEYSATHPQSEGTVEGRNESNDNINEVGGYLQTTTSLLPKLDLLAAARVDANSRMNGSQFSPRAALIFKPDANNTFRLTFNRAYGSPTSFSLFLDQFTGATPAPGMPVQVIGNPSKEGWTFNRSCSGAAGALCMRSPYVPGVVGVSAAAAYAELRGAVRGAWRFERAGGNHQSAAGQCIRRRRGDGASTASVCHSTDPWPSANRCGSRERVCSISRASAPLTSPPSDYAPLGATFANTWEAGYKGFLGKRLGLSVDAWFQKRPAEPTTQIINPAVLFNGSQLGAYLGANRGGTDCPGRSAGAGASAGRGVGRGAGRYHGQSTRWRGGLHQLAVRPTIPGGLLPGRHGLDQRARGRRGNGSLARRRLVGRRNLLELEQERVRRCPRRDSKKPTGCEYAEAPRDGYGCYENPVKRYSLEVRGRYADAFPVNSGVLNSYNIERPSPMPRSP